MDIFLKELSGKHSKKTLEKYRYILELFHDYLANYAELSHEENGNNMVLTADTQELHDDQASNFLEWFLIRKVIGPAWINTSASGIMKKYIQWLDKKDFLQKEQWMMPLR